MLLIRRFLTISFTIIGSLTAIILLAVINSLANTGLTGGEVVLYGILGGILLGVAGTYLLINYVIRKVKRLLLNRFANGISKFSFLRRL